jgi:hypothetical protein
MQINAKVSNKYFQIPPVQEIPDGKGYSCELLSFCIFDIYRNSPLNFNRMILSLKAELASGKRKQRQLYLDMDVPVPTNVTSLCVDAEI